MKTFFKWTIKLLVFSIFVVSSLFVFAWSLPSSVTWTLDRFVDRMTLRRSDLSHEQQQAKHQTMIAFLNKALPQVSEDKQPIALYLKSAFQQNLSELDTPTAPSEGSYSIPNVDMQAVRDAWLGWHNEARARKWLYVYKWSPELEITAHNWSVYLASLNASTHKRKASDWYYNYTSILEWFNNQWVYFVGNWTSFTENIAYQYYSCNSADCTQNLISAIKKWFDFFMSEESYNWAHYRGIMHGSFTRLGMGIAFIGKRYWIVTHYSKEIK